MQASAAKALKETDEKEIEGKKISVAISNPPPHKEPTKNKSNVPITTSLGQAPRATGPRGRGHSQIALVPRKVTTTTSTTSKSESTSTTTMSNDDFRKMLLNKK